MLSVVAGLNAAQRARGEDTTARGVGVRKSGNGAAQRVVRIVLATAAPSIGVALEGSVPKVIKV